MPDNKILIISSAQNKNFDAQKHLELLKKSTSFFNRRKFYIVSDSDPKSDAYIQNTKGVILFGYKDSNYPIINTNKGPIGTSWFKNNYSVAVFFMPDGDKLLKHNSWDTIFHSWVTFSGKFQFLIMDLPVLESIIPKVYDKMFDSIRRISNAKEIKKIIEAAYDHAILTILTKEIKKPGVNKDDIAMSILKISCNKNKLVIK